MQHVIEKCESFVFHSVSRMCFPSVLWHCCPGDRKDFEPVKTHDTYVQMLSSKQIEEETEGETGIDKLLSPC